jgi:hypothetical protein
MPVKIINVVKIHVNRRAMWLEGNMLEGELYQLKGNVEEGSIQGFLSMASV